MSARALGFAVFVAASLHAAPGSPVSSGYWLQAQPASPAEIALREVLDKNAFAGPPATSEALRQFSAAHPGTAASGLAQLAAGLLLLESGKPAEAIPCLRHPDLARTSLPDHAGKALAEAQEAGGDAAAAGASYAAAVEARPDGPLVCPALFRAAETFAKTGLPDKAIDALTRTLASCPNQARALLQIGTIQEARHDLRAAAAAFEEIEPASPEAREAQRRLRALGAFLPPLTPEERSAREMKRALGLEAAGRYADAVAALRAVLGRKPKGEDADLVHTRLGHALLSLNRPREAETELAAVRSESPYAAEAAFHRAKSELRLTAKSAALEAVADNFPGTPWGEEALYALAAHYQKDSKFDQALPYYRRLLADYPEGQYADRATWPAAWADYRAGRLEDAAQALERAVRLRPVHSSTPGYLYWAGRARHDLKQDDRARQLLDEVRQRFKYTYYGMRAGETRGRLTGAGAAPAPELRRVPADPALDVPEPQLTRARQLLLIDRLEEARDELAALPPTTTAQATIAWIEWRRGRLRPAITAMRRAYPEYVGEAGDHLPEEIWRILYPLDYSGLLQQKATEEGLDPALVAALICQESTFNAGALSRAGARGLMQVIPPTGRRIAQALRVRWSAQALYDPATSLDFGTRYLKDMVDRYGGRLERALAAYNAGPHRVDAWTAGRPDMPAEEFIESIPFTETRFYVMAILSAQEQYRRIYSFPAAAMTTAPGPLAAAASPR